MENPGEEGLISIFSPLVRTFIDWHFDKSYKFIAEDLEKGILKLSKETVKLEDLELPPKHGSESEEHRLLKANAAKLLREKGERNVEYEAYANSDIYGYDLDIRVECGSTHGSRIYRSILRTNEFWVLQYPKRSDSKKTYLYKFKVNHKKILEHHPELKNTIIKEKIK